MVRALVDIGMRIYRNLKNGPETAKTYKKSPMRMQGAFKKKIE
jgi:hypothetical protein